MVASADKRDCEFRPCSNLSHWMNKDGQCEDVMMKVDQDQLVDDLNDYYQK